MNNPNFSRRGNASLALVCLTGSLFAAGVGAAGSHTSQPAPAATPAAAPASATEFDADAGLPAVVSEGGVTDANPSTDPLPYVCCVSAGACATYQATECPKFATRVDCPCPHVIEGN